ncbi:hypothetical protein M5K25_000593 [Dendrobium thyrsiflorum]|uniref:Di19 C-terminal domain-containing protein n=1 Tax=Dendrobium thyrsiflorum TaxID=117978 RepID=A0ABD0VUV7_DENTH
MLGSHSTLSLLRKELREANAQALIGGWSHSGAPPSAAPDPLLSSLIYTLPVANSSNDILPESPDEGALASDHSEKQAVERFETFDILDIDIFNSIYLVILDFYLFLAKLYMNPN